MESGDVRHIVREGDSLFVIRGNGPRYSILPCAKDSFYYPNDKGAFLRFVRNEKGLVTGQVFHQLGLDEKALKINR